MLVYGSYYLIYEYKDTLFMETSMEGSKPLLLKNFVDPIARDKNAFSSLMAEFYNLPKGERKKYRVGGGCIQF
jgi:hypothetical protein